MAAPQIHPRALVHPQAKIGENTIIGPDVIIDEHVEIGTDCEIRARAVITGYTKMGNHNQVGYGAIIGSEPQDVSFKNEETYVNIGDHNIFREYVTVNRGTKSGTATTIGNHNMLFTGAHVAHNVTIGNHATLINNVLLAGYVEIQDRAFLGGDVVVHQFTRIGSYAMVRGQTRLGMDIPPFCMAVDTNVVSGLNRVGLRRAGFAPSERRLLQEAFNVIYKQNLNRSDAVAYLRANSPFAESALVQQMCDFIKGTRRGTAGLYVKGKRVIEDED
ncbi:MAG: acyl-ACP--UDP-N-acetylglucosamine O-acyltransferase [Pseudanabaenaceae cyanobacterium]|jgi:UDP-N-acetylglucosamine acyltransferase